MTHQNDGTPRKNNHESFINSLISQSAYLKIENKSLLLGVMVYTTLNMDHRIPRRDCLRRSEQKLSTNMLKVVML